jgi:hypothetical protein
MVKVYFMFGRERGPKREVSGLPFKKTSDTVTLINNFHASRVGKNAEFCATAQVLQNYFAKRASASS